MSKRFELFIDDTDQYQIADILESEIRCIYNDLGRHPFSAAPSLCDMLNDLHEKNETLSNKLEVHLQLTDDERRTFDRWYKQLKQENEQLKKELFEIRKDYERHETLIRDAANRERTALGSSVLKQLAEAFEIEL